ncbi:MAG: hypothetical protein E6772_12800 [Dysgonomonas sp.]|nr:hypothetical protein [Dysgonomonas sp.]
MNTLSNFISNNKHIIVSVLLGNILGLIYWYHFGCFWGVYPYSSEWWFNFIGGGAIFGFISCIVQKRVL